MEIFWPSESIGCPIPQNAAILDPEIAGGETGHPVHRFFQREQSGLDVSAEDPREGAVAGRILMAVRRDEGVGLGGEADRDVVGPRAAALQPGLDLVRDGLRGAHHGAAGVAAQALRQEDLVPSEPVTVVLSRSGWVRLAMYQSSSAWQVSS